MFVLLNIQMPYASTKSLIIIQTVSNFEDKYHYYKEKEEGMSQRKFVIGKIRTTLNVLKWYQ